MFKQTLSIKDQFGVKYAIQATVDHDFATTQSHSNIKHITVDGEDIRPSFEMLFQSTLSGKIFKIIQKYNFYKIHSLDQISEPARYYAGFFIAHIYICKPLLMRNESSQLSFFLF